MTWGCIYLRKSFCFQLKARLEKQRQDVDASEEAEQTSKVQNGSTTSDKTIQLTSNTTTQTSDKMTSKAQDKTTLKVLDKTSPSTSDKTMQKASDKTSPKLGPTESVPTSDKTSIKVVSKTTLKKSDDAKVEAEKCEFFRVVKIYFLCHCPLLSLKHCDQMARLFVQYLAIYNNENLPNGIKICQSTWVQNFQKKNETLHNAKSGPIGLPTYNNLFHF